MTPSPFLWLTPSPFRHRISVIAVAACVAFAASVRPANAEEPDAEPLAEHLQEMVEKGRKSIPAEVMQAYGEGIEATRQSGVVERALQEGDDAPDFSLPDHEGNPVRLSEALGQGPVVLTWYRGGWCPACNLQLASYRKMLPELEKLDAQLIAVSPQRPDGSVATVEKLGLEYRVLSDVGLKVAEEYGLVFELTPEVAEIYGENYYDRDELYGDGEEGNRLPLAATYVIDTDGSIVFTFVDADYTKRAEPSDILDAVRELKK